MPYFLELQSCFAGGIGQGLDASVVKIAAAVKHHLLNALFLSALRDHLADVLCRAKIAASGLCLLLTLASFDGRSRDQCLARGIVDDLGIDMVQRTIDVQPRTGARAGELAADAAVNSVPGGISFNVGNHLLLSASCRTLIMPMACSCAACSFFDLFIGYSFGPVETWPCAPFRQSFRPSSF